MMKVYMVEFNLNGESKWTSLKAKDEWEARLIVQNWAIGKGDFYIERICEC